MKKTGFYISTLCLALAPLVVQGQTVGPIVREKILRTEELVEKRNTTTRVWRNTVEIPELDDSGTPTGASKEVVLDVIEKADGLFYRDSRSGDLLETSEEWTKSGDEFIIESRRDSMSFAVRRDDQKPLLSYVPDGDHSIFTTVSGFGYYNSKTGEFSPIIPVEGNRLSEIPKTEQKLNAKVSVDTRSGAIGVETHPTRTGVHLDFVIHDRGDLPTPPANTNPGDLIFGARYEIETDHSDVVFTVNGNRLRAGASKSGSDLQIGIGARKGNGPYCRIEPGRIYPAQSTLRPPPYTYRRILSTGVKLEVFEGINLEWLQNEETSYPVVIDPYYVRSGTSKFLGETFESGKTYFISDDYTVPGHHHLIIEPGAFVKINGGKRIISSPENGGNGTISVIGEPYNHVIVTSADDNDVGAPIPTGSLVPGPHKGFLIQGYHNWSQFHNMKMNNWLIGIKFENYSPPPRSDAVINSTVRDCIFGDFRSGDFCAPPNTCGDDVCGDSFAIGIISLNTGNSAKDISLSNPLTIVNNLFKETPSVTDGPISAVGVFVDGGAQMHVEIINNTFANRNDNVNDCLDNGFDVSSVLAVFYKDSQGLPVETAQPATLILRNNAFTVTNNHNHAIAALNYFNPPNKFPLTLQIHNNITTGFNGVTLANEQYLNTNFNTLSIQPNVFKADVFESVSGVGDYFIESSVLGDFIDKGAGSAAQLGLEGKTIRPPIELVPIDENPLSISEDTTWRKQGDENQAFRDVGVVDIGYHYDPVDYAIGVNGVAVVDDASTPTLTIEPGTVIASPPGKGLRIGGANKHGSLKSMGAPGEEIRWYSTHNTGDGMTCGEFPLVSSLWTGVQFVQESGDVNVKFNHLHNCFRPFAISAMDCTIRLTDNVLDNFEYGCYLAWNAENPESRVIIENNRLVGKSYGAGIHLYNAKAEISNNTLFMESKTLAPFLAGIEVNIDGEMDSSPRISNNVVIGGDYGFRVHEEEEEYCTGEIRAIFMDNVSWNALHGLNLWTVNEGHVHMNSQPTPHQWNPRYVSSREQGFNDASEHFFLAQHRADASRVPFTLKNSLAEADGIRSIGMGGAGGIEVWTLDAGLNWSFHGSHRPGDPSFTRTGTQLGTGTPESAGAPGDVLVMFVGPLTIGPDAALTIKTEKSSEIEVALPAVWKDPSWNSADPDSHFDPVSQTEQVHVVCFWLSMDGSLYYANQVFPDVDNESIVFDGEAVRLRDTFLYSLGGLQSPPADITANYAMTYITGELVPKDASDLDHHTLINFDRVYKSQSVYSGALAISAFDQKMRSEVQDAIVGGPQAFSDYPGTPAQFFRKNKTTIQPARDLGFLDLGYHPFRGRFWTNDDQGIRITWDAPFDHESGALTYGAELKVNGVTSGTWADVAEDSHLDARDKNEEELPETLPGDVPHSIELWAIDDSEEGERAVIEFGYDKTPPDVNITTIVSIDDSPSVSFHNQGAEPTVFYKGGTTPPDAVYIIPGMTDVHSGPWKYRIVVPEEEFPRYYKFDPLNPVEIELERQPGTTSFILDGWDYAGNKCSASVSESILFVQDGVAPDCGELEDISSSVSSVIEVKFKNDKEPTDLPGEEEEEGDHSGLNRVDFYVSRKVSGIWDTPVFFNSIRLSNPFPTEPIVTHLDTRELVSGDEHKVIAEVFDNVGNMCSTESFYPFTPNNSPASANAVTLKAVDLRCEFRRNPVGIGTERPRFSWAVAPQDPSGTPRGAVQTAYQIQVAHTNSFDSEEILWDSISGVSDQSNLIEYPDTGVTALASGHTYWWRVKVKNSSNVWSTAWSDAARFTMGLLGEDPWHEATEWIGASAGTGERHSKTTVPAGCRTVGLEDPVDGKFVLDLGSPQLIDEIRFYPAWNPEVYHRATQQTLSDILGTDSLGRGFGPGTGMGYMFPREFEVTLCNNPTKNTIVDSRIGFEYSPLFSVTKGKKTLPTPMTGGQFLAIPHRFAHTEVFAKPDIYKIDPKVPFQYLIYETHNLMKYPENPPSTEPFGWAFAEIEVLFEGKNLARGKSLVSKPGLYEDEPVLWDESYLTDGIIRSGEGPMALFRTKFNSPAQANYFEGTDNKVLLFIAGLGHYDLTINGKPINNNPDIDPSLADSPGRNFRGQVNAVYSERVGIQTLDITKYVNQSPAGVNAIGVRLTEGYYTGPLWYIGSYLYGNQPAFRLEVREAPGDGGAGQVLCKTTGDWKGTTKSDVVSHGVVNGEQFIEHPEGGFSLNGWNMPEYIEGNFLPVNDSVAVPEGFRFENILTEPLEIVEDMEFPDPDNDEGSVLVMKSDTRRVYDLQANVGGHVRLHLNLAAGNGVDRPVEAPIRIRHAQFLDDHGDKIRLYFEDLEGAAQTDSYLLKRSDQPKAYILQPHNSFHGFRYIEVSGLEEGDEITKVTRRRIHQNAEVSGTFSCSNSNLTKLVDACVDSLKGNMQGYIMSTPAAFETMGWSDWGNMAMDTSYLFNTAPFFSKCMDDVKDSVFKSEGILDESEHDGLLCDFVPVRPSDLAFLLPFAFYGSPGWGDNFLDVPLHLHTQYGEGNVNEDMLDTFVTAVDKMIDGVDKMIDEEEENSLWVSSIEDKFGNFYGDWGNGDILINVWDWNPTGATMPNGVYGTAYLARAASHIVKMQKIEGDDAKAKDWAAKARKVKKEFLKEYYSESTDEDLLTGDTIGGYALALDFDLLVKTDSNGELVDDTDTVIGINSESVGVVDPAKVKRGLDRLVDRLQRRGYRLDTGFRSTPSLMNALVRFGRQDVAFRLLTNEDVPSWLYPITIGLNILPEHWDSYVADREPSAFSETNDRNNVYNAYGHIAGWMYRNIAGIQANESAPGFKEFVIRPSVRGDLSCAKAELDSMHGSIVSHWWIDSNCFHLRVTVPVNTKAVVYVPAENQDLVDEIGLGTGNEHSPAFVGPGVERKPDLDQPDEIAFEVASGDYEFVSTSAALFPNSGQCACDGCGCCPE